MLRQYGAASLCKSCFLYHFVALSIFVHKNCSNLTLQILPADDVLREIQNSAKKKKQQDVLSRSKISTEEMEKIVAEMFGGLEEFDAYDHKDWVIVQTRLFATT